MTQIVTFTSKHNNLLFSSIKDDSRFSYKLHSSISDLAFRCPTPGPELNLVLSYLERFPIRIPEHHSVTIFIEPLIESTYPDIAICIWDNEKKVNWTPTREALDKFDIKVWYAILTVTSPTTDLLKLLFGRRLNKSLDKLYHAGLVVEVGSLQRAINPHSQIVLRNLIAVEAKISDLGRALDQAIFNQWFATDSIVLLEKLPAGSKYSDITTKHGIVLTTPRASQRGFRKHKRIDVLRSYASLLFNEYVIRENQIGMNKRCRT